VNATEPYTSVPTLWVNSLLIWSELSLQDALIQIKDKYTFIFILEVPNPANGTSATVLTLASDSPDCTSIPTFQSRLFPYSIISVPENWSSCLVELDQKYNEISFFVFGKTNSESVPSGYRIIAEECTLGTLFIDIVLISMCLRGLVLPLFFSWIPKSVTHSSYNTHNKTLMTVFQLLLAVAIISINSY